MKLAYRGFDKGGQAVAQTIEAASVAEATETLRKQGYYVTEIAEAAVSAAKGVAKKKRLSAGKRLRYLATFSRQLYVLIHTGTPLVQSLGALERQTKDPTWREVLRSLRERVEEGGSLSRAMDAYPQYFDPVYRSLIAAGEASSSFGPMLDRLSILTRKQLKIRSSVAGAAVYPALLTVICTVVVIIMLTFVLPRFTGLFDSLDVELPPTTKMLIVLSDFLRGYAIPLIVALVGGVFGLRYWLRTPHGRESWDSILLKLPQIGVATRSFCTARMARVLGVLLESQVPMLEAIKLSREAAGNAHYARLLDKAEQAVTRGEPISSAFANTDLIGPSVYEAIYNGEQTGQVGPLLVNIAEFLDEENDILVRSLTSLLEPIILMVMGALVGFIAVSMFLPLFDLTAMAGQS